MKSVKKPSIFLIDILVEGHSDASKGASLLVKAIFALNELVMYNDANAI